MCPLNQNFVFDMLKFRQNGFCIIHYMYPSLLTMDEEWFGFDVHRNFSTNYTFFYIMWNAKQFRFMTEENCLVWSDFGI